MKNRRNPLLELYEEVFEEKLRAFADPEDALRANWDNLPIKIQDELIAIGFKLRKKE